MLVLLPLAKKRGISPSQMIENTGLPLSYILNRRNWLTWEHFLQILNKVMEGLSDQELISLGEVAMDSPVTNILKVVGPVLPSELSLYRWAASFSMGPSALFYRCMRMSVREVSPLQLEIELRTPPGDIRVFGTMFQGAFAHIPRLGGAPKATVQFELQPGLMRYQVTLEERWRLASLWRRLFFNRQAHEARTAYEMLLERNAELQRQVEVVRATEAERQRLAEGLRRAQRLESVGRLAGGVSHDFNNLLTVIQCHADFLELELPEGSPLLADVHGVKEASRRAAGLTRQLLAFSRQQVLELGDVDVAQTIRGVEHMLRTLLGDQHALVLDLGHHPAVFRGDQGQLEQVLMNLTANARHAMGSGGTLTIQLSTEPRESPDGEAPGTLERWICLTVSDTGVGMDQATLDLVFEPFFTTKGSEGTGLGMATVHGIVHQFGGTMNIESQVGVGTSVLVRLPYTGDQITPVQAVAVSPSPRVRGQWVLVVEDEATVRSVLVRTLENAGYKVLQAATGAEGFRIASQNPKLALVLSDLVMPELSGRELVQRLRQMRPELPVVLMSGYAEGVASTEELGAADFLAKPILGATLVSKVEEVLRRSHSASGVA